MNMLNRQKFKFFLPYFLLALAIIVTFRITGHMELFANGFRWFWGVISPFFAGFILAYIINIPISGIQKLLARADSNPIIGGIQNLLTRTDSKLINRMRKPLASINASLMKASKNTFLIAAGKFMVRRQRMLSVIIVALSIVGIIALALIFIIPAIQTSIDFLEYNIPVYIEAITRVINDFNDMELFGMEPIDIDWLLATIGDIFVSLTWEQITQPLNFILGVGTAVFNGAIAFISSIYILIEKDRFKAYLRKLIRIFMRDDVEIGILQVFGGLSNNVRTYIKTQTIDGIILGTMATIFLWAIGSPFALILGIMLGIVNYIPYFGSIFGTIVAVIVVTITQGIGMGAISLASLLVIQQIDANIIQPRLMSDSFSLSPLLVIISITFGGAIAGIIGMFVAIPVVAVLKDIFDAVVEYYEVKKFGVLMDAAEIKEGEGNNAAD